MSLLHPALLAGLGLAIIPILLHLMLRAKPKRLIFPALRLIQQSRRQNVRRLQLRHLWLLLLRILVIALIVVAFSRPSLPAANYSLVWYEWTMIVVVIGLGLAIYFGILTWWTRHGRSQRQILTRRTMLRGGVGAITALLLLFGVGWPYARRVSAEMKSPAPKPADNIPVAAIFLFDTSSSMGYRQGNQTRLQSAQQIAREHLSRLPGGSKVAVMGSHETSSPAFALDLQAARTKIDSHDIKAAGLPLNELLRFTLLAQEDDRLSPEVDRRRVTSEQPGPGEQQQDRYLREIYLFTDLTRSAWREETSTLLRDELKRLENVAVYLIDVGETAPSNVGITSVKLSRESIPAGGTLRIDTVVSSTGNVKPEQTVELLLAGQDGKLLKKAQQTEKIESGTERRLSFEVPIPAGRYQQGEVRIVGSDPLSVDDVGFFTVQTLPQLKVLIVAENQKVAEYWKLTLDKIAAFKITDFQTEFQPASRLAKIELSAFDLVCLINVSAPDETAWKRLHDFVEMGGGLSVFLGANSSATVQSPRSDLINPVFYNSPAAQSVLPATLTASTIHKPPQTMDLRETQHPFLKRLDDFSALGEIGAIEVRRYWKVAPNRDAITVAKYSITNGTAALVERRVGQGRVMLMTTGVDSAEWNDLVLFGNGWSFVFAEQLMLYLSRQASIRCNYLIGDEVALPLDHQRKLKKVLIRMPDFKQRTQEITADSKAILLRDLGTVGSYQVDSAEGDVDYHTGFSLMLPARESDLRRLETADLDALLGEGRYSVNRDPGSLQRNVQAGRLGQEIYSIVLALLIAVFALEQFTATWFYRTDGA